MAVLALGVVLNPLNSSMISIGLVSVGEDLHVSLAATTSLVVAFYVASGVGQPIMGRLADRFGARRIFVAGFGITGVACALAPFAPSLAWLVAARVGMAIGTSASYPCCLSLIRRAVGPGRPPTAALGTLAMASSGAAALGPAVGGGRVDLAGWQALFVVNIPITVTAGFLALRWLPAVDGGTDAIALAAPPDARRIWLIADPGMRWIYLRFVLVTSAFYSVVYGLPMWLERIRGFGPSETGLLMMPVAGLMCSACPSRPAS